MKKGIFLLLAFTLQAFATVHLHTEEYPPFNMKIKGKITGAATEIVEELFKRAGVEYKITLQAWNMAYNTAKDKPGHAVYSTTHTEARHPLFKWVGPVAKNNWVFMAKKGSPIKVNSLEDAKKYRIGGYKGDAIAEFLKKKGLNVIEAKIDHRNAIKLDKGQIDLWATGHLLGPHIAKLQNIEGLEVVHQFNSTEMDIAFNIDTDDSLIKKLKAELKKMYADGTVEKIEKKYQ